MSEKSQGTHVSWELKHKPCHQNTGDSLREQCSGLCGDSIFHLSALGGPGVQEPPLSHSPTSPREP